MKPEEFLSAANPLPVMLWMNQGQLVINDEAKRYFGQRTNTPSQEEWVNRIHSQDVAFVLWNWNRCLDSHLNHCVEYRVRRGDGKWRWVRSVGVPKKGFFVGSMLDINDEKLVEQTYLRQAGTLPMPIYDALKGMLSGLEKETDEDEDFVVAWQTSDSLSDVCCRIRLSPMEVMAKADHFVRNGVRLKSFSYNNN